MEQLFVVIAVIVFWIFRGVAGAGQRRLPGQDPYGDDHAGPGGTIDISGATRDKTIVAQKKALEALQRWEAKQGLSAGKSDSGHSAGRETVPATSRTRTGRPAQISRRTTAARQRKQAFADIARMLDPEQGSGAPPARRPGFEVSRSSSPDREAARPVADRRPSDAAMKRDAEQKEEEAQRELAARKAAVGAGAGKTSSSATTARLARLESLPLAARAIVYAEILGRPRSLS